MGKSQGLVYTLKLSLGINTLKSSTLHCLVASRITSNRSAVHDRFVKAIAVAT